LSQSREHGPIQFRHPEKAREAIRQSIDENGEREAIIDRRALEAKALQHAMGSVELDQIRTESERFHQDGRLIVAGALMRAGQGRVAAIGSSNEIRRWASQRNVLPDQTAVAELTLASTDWITSIEGRAGAAKTTTVGAIREFAEEHGYAVCGFAPTTRAVKSLSEAGVIARTVASLLESQSARDASNEVWIVDESSLLPTRQVNWLLNKAREQNVKRIVFVGDQGQHHAIEAGRPIYQMQEAGMLVARLDTIRRQRDPELREAVMHAARGEVAESLAILDRRGDIREAADIEQRRKQIAHEYVAAHQSGERVLVVSPANDERRELNKAMRAELIARGHVSPLGTEQTLLVNRGLSGAQRAMAYNYNEGDVIRFTRGSKQFAIPKGGYGRVEAVDREANVLTINTGSARRIKYNPVRLFGVEVFREEQRTIARGERIQFRAPDRALGVANGEFATITAIDAHRAVVHLDNGKQLSVGRRIVYATSTTDTLPRRTPRKARPLIASLWTSTRSVAGTGQSQAVLRLDQPRAKIARNLHRRPRSAPSRCESEPREINGDRAPDRRSPLRVHGPAR
jgi:AAA domain